MRSIYRIYIFCASILAPINLLCLADEPTFAPPLQSAQQPRSIDGRQLPLSNKLRDFENRNDFLDHRMSTNYANQSFNDLNRQSGGLRNFRGTEHGAPSGERWTNFGSSRFTPQNFNLKRLAPADFNNSKLTQTADPGKTPSHFDPNNSPDFDRSKALPYFDSNNPPSDFNSGKSLPYFDPLNPPSDFNSGKSLPYFDPRNPPPNFNSGKPLPYFDPGNPPPNFNSGKPLPPYFDPRNPPPNFDHRKWRSNNG